MSESIGLCQNTGPDKDVRESPRDLIITVPPTDTESIYDYEPGGHHPVHLGDILHNRYKVIHKLGTGGSANVWLCRDTSSSKTRYVAIKIIMAEFSASDCPELRINRLIAMGVAAEAAAEHFCLPLDQFSITGPNGEHHALVYPVLGPRVSELHDIVYDGDLDFTLRKIAGQVTQAMSTLHANGICHGDFRPTNILARISNLDGISEEEVFTLLGKPEQASLMTRTEKKHELPTVPQYLVYPIDWEYIAQKPSGRSLLTGDACIIDFGESFEILNPPQRMGIPQAYCAPEYVLDKRIGPGCDVWALACTLFEIRTGRQLFETFEDDEDELLYRLARVLGKFPEPWWSTTWKTRKQHLEDEVDEDGKVVSSDEYEDKSDDEETTNGRHDIGPVWQMPEPRSIRESMEAARFSRTPEPIRHEITEAEVDCFADLLEGLLQYLPEERLVVADALKHPWFRMQEARPSIRSTEP
ncbi:kinase-like domain-containing protein [Xylaria venustula]|nr:kinase-like domain-containing protein [Xylaria venustula]